MSPELPPESGSKNASISPGNRLKLLLWQLLATVGLLAASMAILYFRYLRYEDKNVAQWPLFNWVLVALVTVLSLWAGPGIAKLVAGYIQHRANAKTATDKDQQARHQQRRHATWFEWQMITASWLGIVALSLVFNGFALGLGIYALAVCKHQQARRKATVLTALSGCLTIAGLFWGMSKLGN